MLRGKIVSVILSKKVHMNVCPTLNGHGDIAIEIKNTRHSHYYFEC
jgi:hypothetical protein